MKGYIGKRCTRCPQRGRYKEGDRRCPKCGATEHTWTFSVDVGLTTEGKRRRIERGGFATKRDAQKSLEEIVAKADRGGILEPSKRTVAQFLVDEWLPSMEMGIERTTWEGYREKIHSYVLSRIGPVVLAELKPPKLNAMYADIRKHGRIRGDDPLALKTVREVHVILHRAFKDAVQWEYIEANPASKANPPSATAAKNQRKKAMQTWTAAEVNEFARQFHDHEFFPLWLLAASSAMRRSELLGTRWKAIDFDRGLLAIRQVLVKVGGKGEFKEAPKSAHGFRTIQIAPRVLAVLRDLRRKQAEVRLRAQVWHDNDLVFCRPDGNPWHPDHVTETVREMIEASGLPRIRPLQDLRHTHATLLLADGENAKVVQERLGHHSHSFTADTYQHVMPGMDAAAASRFDGLVFGNDGNDEDKPDETA